MGYARAIKPSVHEMGSRIMLLMNGDSRTGWENQTVLESTSCVCFVSLEISASFGASSFRSTEVVNRGELMAIPAAVRGHMVAALYSRPHVGQAHCSRANHIQPTSIQPKSHSLIRLMQRPVLILCPKPRIHHLPLHRRTKPRRLTFPRQPFQSLPLHLHFMLSSRYLA
jgi:hypothetical protein